MIAERIQVLGAISLAMAADVAETTIIRRPPRREEVPVQFIPSARGSRNRT
jgi:starvation-inducible DNA-binding protein